MLKISLVTPCYNSETFIEATIQSVLSQHDPNLEYIIVDGQSTDGTVDIIRQYEDQLADWVSEPDAGMYDAIQKGFDRSTGDIMGYINSDDLHLSWTCRVVREIFESLPHVEWITSLRPLLVNEQGTIAEGMALDGFHKQAFMHGENIPGFGAFHTEMIQQESTFWRRSLWEKSGGRLDTSLTLAGDQDLWARFYQHSDLVGCRVPLAAFRIHASQLTSQQRSAYFQEAHDVLKRQGGSPYSHGRRVLRRLAVRHNPPGKRLMARAGVMYKATIGVYDFTRQTWTTKPVYI